MEYTHDLGVELGEPKQTYVVEADLNFVQVT